MSTVARFRRLAVAAFKRHGQLTLDAEGVRVICEALEAAVAERGECSDADLQPLLDAIVGACKVRACEHWQLAAGGFCYV